MTGDEGCFLRPEGLPHRSQDLSRSGVGDDRAGRRVWDGYSRRESRQEAQRLTRQERIGQAGQPGRVEGGDTGGRSLQLEIEAGTDRQPAALDPLAGELSVQLGEQQVDEGRGRLGFGSGRRLEGDRPSVGRWQGGRGCPCNSPETKAAAERSAAAVFQSR